MIKTYIEKPKAVLALQIQKDNFEEIRQFCPGCHFKFDKNSLIDTVIVPVNSVLTMAHGKVSNYIVKEPNGSIKLMNDYSINLFYDEAKSLGQ